MSPADGHCLIHSVVSSVNPQIDNAVYFGVFDILEAIKTETITHMDEYVEFLEAESKDMVWGCMENYVRQKVYVTSYGDLLPFILADALCLNFIVISETILLVK